MFPRLLLLMGGIELARGAKPVVSRCSIHAQETAYSITSSARASSIGGTLRPSALAVSG